VPSSSARHFLAIGILVAMGWVIRTHASYDWHFALAGACHKTSMGLAPTGSQDVGLPRFSGQVD
jgi:hypothetical protein